MALGSPKTTKFLIGNFELRVGPMKKAGLLTADHSVGLIENVKLDVGMDSVDLMAGFPQEPVDTAIITNVTGLSATLREYSRRNLNILLGNGVSHYDFVEKDRWAQIYTTTAIAKGATTLYYRKPLEPWRGYYDNTDPELANTIYNPDGLTGEDTPDPGTITPIGALNLNDATGLASNAAVAALQAVFRVGDVVAVHTKTDPSRVSLCRVTACDGEKVTFDSGTPVVGDGSSANAFEAGESVFAYRVRTMAGGKIIRASYFSCSLVRIDRRTNRPVGYNVWKATLAGGSSLSASVTEFASTEMQLKFLKPAAVEYTAVTGALYHQKDIIKNNPTFALYDVADYTTDY